MQLSLERVIGSSTRSNACFASNRVTGDVASAAGALVVIHDARGRARMPLPAAAASVTSLAFSDDGAFLAVGVRGSGGGTVGGGGGVGGGVGGGSAAAAESGAQKPSVTIWAMGGDAAGARPSACAHIADAAALSVVGLAFSADARLLVVVGSRDDRQLSVFALPAAGGGGGGGGGARACALVGTGRLSQRVRAVAFLGGARAHVFVTAGERHLKFWDLGALAAAMGLRLGEAAAGAGAGDGAGARAPAAVAALKSKPAVLQEAGAEFEDFVDVRGGAGAADAGRVYALSAAGTLCAFDADSRVLEGWVRRRKGLAGRAERAPKASVWWGERSEPPK